MNQCIIFMSIQFAAIIRWAHLSICNKMCIPAMVNKHSKSVIDQMSANILLFIDMYMYYNIQYIIQIFHVVEGNNENFHPLKTIFNHFNISSNVSIHILLLEYLQVLEMFFRNWVMCFTALMSETNEFILLHGMNS